jgi:phenylacetic acid degradation operon negative regulatory protein
MSNISRASQKQHRKTTARFPTVIYTLFGAYIIHRGGEVRVADLMELVRPLGFSANAIRLGLSRMSRYGVFRIRKVGRESCYSLSAKGMKGMEHGRGRAFETDYKEWDGKWRLVAYNIPESSRVLRDKLRTKLRSMGFANLGAAVWISPHSLLPEMLRIIDRNGMAQFVEMFEAEYEGPHGIKQFVARTWHINNLEKGYRAFVRKYTGLHRKFKQKARTHHPMTSSECFAERFCMTAEYVALRLDDPMLPLALLPDKWVGMTAHRLHDTMWALLEPAAVEFVDSVLQK